MKKIILAVFASMILASPVYADEEIQLAAVMEDSGSSSIEANKKIYARSGGGFGRESRDPSYEYAVVTGVIVAGIIAAMAHTESTSNH